MCFCLMEGCFNMVGKIYDLIILGAGPSGCNCAIYAKKYKIDFLMISPNIGGMVNEAHMVDNYLGIPPKEGFKIAKDFESHLNHFGIEPMYDYAKKVSKIDVDGKVLYKVSTSAEDFFTKKVLVAFGQERKKLGVKGEADFLGKGVSYCVTCDAMFFKDKIVAVVGSDDHAASGAAHLAQNSAMVHLINPKPHLECKPYWLEDIKDNPKVKIYNNANLLQILGDDGHVTRILIEQSGERQLIDLDGVFIEMGSVPSVAVISELNLKKDKDGFIIVDDEQRTSEKGIYAAGDITTGSAKFFQIITAASEGAVAAFTIFKDLRKDKAE